MQLVLLPREWPTWFSPQGPRCSLPLERGRSKGSSRVHHAAETLQSQPSRRGYRGRGVCLPPRGRGAEAREHLHPQPCRLAVGECRVVLEALREPGDGRAEAIGFGGAAQRDGRPAARAHRRDEQRGRRVGVEEAAWLGLGLGLGIGLGFSQGSG